MFFDLGSPPKGPPPPFPSWHTRQVKVVEKAIAAAWQDLMSKPHARALLMSGKEVEITAMLQDSLTTLLQGKKIRGFSPAIFAPPIRGQELEDYSGEYLVSALTSVPTFSHRAHIS